MLWLLFSLETYILALCEVLLWSWTYLKHLVGFFTLLYVKMVFRIQDRWENDTPPYSGKEYGKIYFCSSRSG